MVYVVLIGVGVRSSRSHAFNRVHVLSGTCVMFRSVLRYTLSHLPRLNCMYSVFYTVYSIVVFLYVCLFCTVYVLSYPVFYHAYPSLSTSHIQILQHSLLVTVASHPIWYPVSPHILIQFTFGSLSTSVFNYSLLLTPKWNIVLLFGGDRVCRVLLR